MTLPLITSVIVARGPRHDYVRVYNRGGACGSLTVEQGDGEAIAERLMTGAYDRQPDDDGIGVVFRPQGCTP